MKKKKLRERERERERNNIYKGRLRGKIIFKVKTTQEEYT